MSLNSMRPTFETQLSISKDEFVRRIGEVLRTPAWYPTSFIFEDYAELHIPRAEIRYWSPHLSLYFEKDGEATRVFGRFAPRQEVWTLVWIVYLSLAFTAFFALIYGYAQWTLGVFTWVNAIAPLSLAGIGLLYVASYVGQQWSADQMLVLREKWQQLVEEATGSPCPPAAVQR